MIRKHFLWVALTVALLVLFPACSSSPETETAGGGPAEASEAPAGRLEGAEREEDESAMPADPSGAPLDSARDEAVEPVAPVDRSESADKGVADDAAVKEVRPAPGAPDMDALRKPTVDHPIAPAEFRARFETTKGDFVVRLVRDWSPRGVDHFHHLVKVGYYQDIAFFRAIEGFMVQFGMHGDPVINELWADTSLTDDPVKVSNKRGYLTYAKTNLPNSRSTQLFINLVDNANLDSYGFSPMGEVVEGISVLDSLYMGYGEGAPRGRGPSQELIGRQGNRYLKDQFPRLDYIKRVVLLD